MTPKTCILESKTWCDPDDCSTHSHEETGEWFLAPLPAFMAREQNSDRTVYGPEGKVCEVRGRMGTDYSVQLAQRIVQLPALEKAVKLLLPFAEAHLEDAARIAREIETDEEVKSIEAVLEFARAALQPSDKTTQPSEKATRWEAKE